MYRVLADFADLKDHNFKYHTGDTYPRKGAEVSTARINELLTGKNRRKMPLIEEVKEAKPKPEEKPKRGAKK